MFLAVLKGTLLLLLISSLFAVGFEGQPILDKVSWKTFNIGVFGSESGRGLPCYQNQLLSELKKHMTVYSIMGTRLGWVYTVENG